MLSAADFDICATCARTRDDCTCKEEALLLKHGLGGEGSAALLAAAMREGGAVEAAASVEGLSVADALAQAAADAAASEARRIAELPAIDFAPQFIPAILSGLKRATTRSFAHEPALSAIGAGSEARAVLSARVRPIGRFLGRGRRWGRRDQAGAPGCGDVPRQRFRFIKVSSSSLPVMNTLELAV